MKRVLALVAVLGMVAMFGMASLVSAECAYHKAQASLEKADSTKEVVATPVPDKTDTNRMRTVKVENPVQPVAEVKK